MFDHAQVELLRAIRDLLEGLVKKESIEDRAEIKLLREIKEEIVDIRDILHPTAKSATLQIEGNMDATILVGKTAQATFTEFDGPDGTGNKVPPVGTVTFTSHNPSVATVDQAGLCTGVSAGTALIDGTDSGNTLQASATLTVNDVPLPAQSETLDLVAV